MVSWPLILDLALQFLVAIVDLAVLQPEIGSASQAAYGFCRPIIWLMFAFYWGYNQATNAVVARYIGAKDPERAQNVVTHVMLFTTYIGIGVGIALVVIFPYVFKLASVDDLVRRFMLEYIIPISAGIVFVFYTYILTGVFQGMGHTRIQLYVSAFMNVFNAILSYFLIVDQPVFPAIPFAGLGWGIKGAAWSLVISRFAAVIVMVLLLRSKRFPICIRFPTFKPQWKIIRPMNIVGFPIALTGIANSVMFIIVNEIAANTRFGTSAITALAVGQNTEWFAWMPALGLMAGVSVMVGQNMGASRIDRAVLTIRSGSWIAFVYLAVWGLIYLYFAEPLVRKYSSDSNVVFPAMMYIYIFAVPVVTYFTLPIHGALRAAGDTTIPMIINLIAMFIVRIPLAYYLTMYTSLDYEGIWWGMAVGMVFENILIFIRYKQGIWKNIKL